MPFSPFQRQEWKTHKWKIVVKDEKTENAVVVELSKQGTKNFSIKKTLFEEKEHTTFLVDFSIAEFLAENRYSEGYQFTPYHRKRDDIPWQEWKEGNTVILKRTQFNRIPAEKKL